MGIAPGRVMTPVDSYAIVYVQSGDDHQAPALTLTGDVQRFPNGILGMVWRETGNRNDAFRLVWISDDAFAD